jgi:hypothetical protein
MNTCVMLSAHLALLYIGVDGGELVTDMNSIAEYLGYLSFVVTWYDLGSSLLPKGEQKEEEAHLKTVNHSNEFGIHKDAAINLFAHPTTSTEPQSPTQQRPHERALVVPIQEVLHMMAAKRGPVLAWLKQADGRSIDMALNQVMRIVHGENDGHDTVASSSSNSARPFLKWTPEDVTTALKLTAEGKGHQEQELVGAIPGKYQDLERTMTINMQAAEIFFHKQYVKPVADEIARTDEFHQVINIRFMFCVGFRSHMLIRMMSGRCSAVNHSTQR